MFFVLRLDFVKNRATSDEIVTHRIDVNVTRKNRETTVVLAVPVFFIATHRELRIKLALWRERESGKLIDCLTGRRKSANATNIPPVPIATRCQLRDNKAKFARISVSWSHLPHAVLGNSGSFTRKTYLTPINVPFGAILNVQFAWFESNVKWAVKKELQRVTWSLYF